MICVRILLCAVACCFVLAACSSDQSIYTDNAAQSVDGESPEDSDNAIPSADDINSESTAGSDNPETVADNEIPVATLQSLAANQSITNFPIDFNGTATSDSSVITAVEILLHNTATIENLQADGTMGPYAELQATLDRPDENATAWSFSVASLPPGPYYIAIRAIDGESQISKPNITNFSVPSSIDNIAPTATLQSLTPDQEITDFPFLFAGDATDDFSGIAAVDIAVYNRATETTLQADGTMGAGAFTRLRATLDNPGENTTAWSLSVASLPPGPYYIAVRAIDGESQISEEILINFSVPSSVDKVVPVVTVQSQSSD